MRYLILLLCLPALAFEPVTYTYEELELMALKKQWKELVLRLHAMEKVPGGKKGQALVGQAVTEHLKSLAKEGLTAPEKEVPALLDKFPFLKRWPELNRFRVFHGFPSIRHCYGSGEKAEVCTKKLKDLVRYDRGNLPLLTKAVEIVKWGHDRKATVPFLEMAITESNAPEACADPVIRRSLASAESLRKKYCP